MSLRGFRPQRVTRILVFITFATALGFGTARAAKVAGLSVVDREYLLVHVLDGEVMHRDDGTGPTAFRAGHSPDLSDAVTYDPPLNTDAAAVASLWRVVSADDAVYGPEGRSVAAVHRKSKVNGHSEEEWAGNDFRYDYTFEHFLYLRLDSPMVQGRTYTVSFPPEFRLDQSSAQVTFDIFRGRSEAIHVNLVGYPAGMAAPADVYIWMGDGGARDYRAFEGNAVYLYDPKTGERATVGTLAFGRKSGDDVGWFNLTRSDVWIADAALPARSGTYRLAIEGIGCSPDFTVGGAVYGDPFRVAVRGYYYMRIGEAPRDDIRPVPRQPRFIPVKDPADTVVYLTEMHPWHPEWKTFASGDSWDKPDDWRRFRKPGNPTNPDAWGGHSDALDWDRHLGHVASIYDLLLAYILTDGVLDADDIGIAESGNGIPDLLDEARNEVDFWLRLRDGEGYSHGLTCPSKDNEFYQAAPTAIAAWANAANAAMMSNAFLVAGRKALSAAYRDHAIEAFEHARGLPDPMLDRHQDLGNAAMKGRDFMMTAAAYLYNVTGDTVFEDIVAELSVCDGPDAILDDYSTKRTTNQLWAMAGYLKTRQPVHDPELQVRMRTALVRQAREWEAGHTLTRPTRRASHLFKGYFRASHNVDHTLLAHAFAADPAERAFMLQALLLEASYGLGRNPLNMIQMTTATTPLAHLRSVQGAYTSGNNDGTPGMHPGHTPYMNLDDWSPGMTMGTPSRLHGKCYPADFKNTWPIGEGYFDTRYVWAHNEFTPQQTMRGKLLLYAYLHGLEKLGKLSDRAAE